MLCELTKHLLDGMVVAHQPIQTVVTSVKTLPRLQKHSLVKLVKVMAGGYMLVTPTGVALQFHLASHV